ELGPPAATRDTLDRGGIIHDIGKIGVSDSILHKPGPLNAIELPQMQAHVEIGESIVRPLHSTSGLLPIIRHHHERFDGSGYPDGLRAREIPRVARIVSVCEAFDALVNDRPYRTPRATEEALAVLRAGSGTQWDPETVELLATELPTLHHLGAA